MEKQKAPLVVVVHGSPYGIRDYWAYDSEVQLLADRGYAVLQINFRVSGGYGGEYEEVGYLQWVGKIIDDIVDGTQWALSNEALDPNGFVFTASVMVATPSLMGAVRAPEMFKLPEYMTLN